MKRSKQCKQMARTLAAALPLLLLCTATTCEDELYYQDVYLENKSGQDIVAMYWHSRSATSDNEAAYALGLYKSWRVAIEPGDVATTGYFNIDKDGPDSDYLYIIVYEQSTLDAYTEEELAAANRYDALYRCTYDQLFPQSFTITYAGK